MKSPGKPLSHNRHLLRWIEKMAELCARVDSLGHGSQKENKQICVQLVKNGTFIKLNEELWPGCY